jgi:hypothetical protein
LAENNRSQQKDSGSSTQRDKNRGQENQSQNTSGQGIQDQNPQRGSKWSNYQTRELSDEGSGEGNATTP